MSRYIDADRLLNGLKADALYPLIEKYGIESVIDAQPTADLVKVVRCNECIHNVGIRDNTEFYDNDIVCDYWESDGLYSTDFCSYGKRADE